MKSILLPLFALIVVQTSFAQNSYRSYSLFHENGKIVEKPVRVDFLSDRGEIKNKWIHSLTVYSLDSIIFRDNDPDRGEMIGTPIALNFRHQGDSLLVEEYSPEFYALFAAYHTTRALEYFDSLFSGYLNFQNQTEYADLRIFLGRYSNSSPKEYAFPIGCRPSPTLVYHEIGHRTFWLLQDTLHIGHPGDILHMGLLEYFTVSQANHPVVLEGFVPPMLLRDASKKHTFPDDIISYADFWPQYFQAYHDSFAVAPSYKKLYDINLRRMAMWDSTYKMPNVARNVIEAHKSGLVITHPLWELRSHIGQDKCDQLVKTAMLLIPSLLGARSEYLDTIAHPPAGFAQWYDFVYALRVADRQLYRGIHEESITKLFTEGGFDVKGYLRKAH
jgi:hypothetical protein